MQGAEAAGWRDVMVDAVAVCKIAGAVGNVILRGRETQALRRVALLCHVERTLRGVNANGGFGAEDFEEHGRCGAGAASVVHHPARSKAYVAEARSEPIDAALREVLAVLSRSGQSFGERALVGVSEGVEVSGGFHRRPISRTRRLYRGTQDSI